MTEFAFALCNVGSEAFLLSEVARKAPAYRVGFRRPGLLTFRTGEGERTGPSWIFARIAGSGFGLAESFEQVVERAEKSGADAFMVWPRSVESNEWSQAADEMKRELGDRLALPIASAETPEGARVLDVVIDSLEPAMRFYLGLHVHDCSARSSLACATPAAVPPESPSRAYAKLEELLAYADWAPRRGSQALEMGAAPGGAVYSLLRRGVHVTAIDPAPLDPAVLSYRGPAKARATHLCMPIGAVRAEQLPPRIEVVLSDMNLAPPVTLRYVERILRVAPSVRTLLLTLKLNDRAMAERIDEWLTRIEALGFVPRAKQLPSHRQEIGVFARRR